jgi:hypothetical protein
MNEKKPKNYTCKSCRSFQVCSDKNKLPEKLKPCALYQLKGNRQKKNKTMTDILSDIKTLGKNDVIDKCAETDCRYYRTSGCTDNCARGAYGHPDCPYEFLTEEEKKSHPEHRSAINTFGIPKNPHQYCKTIPESLSKDGHSEIEDIIKKNAKQLSDQWKLDLKDFVSKFAVEKIEPKVFDVINADSDLFKACKEYGCEIIIRPIQK